jgi:hypothetical protein
VIEDTNRRVRRGPARIVRAGREVLASPPLRPSQPALEAGTLVGE